MPILELPPNPAPIGDKPNQDASEAARPLKVRTGRFGELEEHELIHLIDSLDDERSRSRFRESVYISVIVYLAIAWFVLYGPRVLFHQPQYDLVKALKDHDKQMTSLELPRTAAPRPPVRAQPDAKVMQKLKEQRASEAPRAPAQPQPAPPQAQAQPTPPPPPEQAHNTPPPPLPSAPTPQPTVSKSTPLPDAPSPSASRPAIAQNDESAHSQMQGLMRGRPGQIGSQSGGYSPPSGPLQAGAEILTDTQGVDFSAYMRRLHNDIQRNWDPLIPAEVQPPLSKRGIVGIRFTIKADGQIGAMTLETRSGDVALDRAAWAAITSEGNFPPLPTAFHGPSIELRCGFFYNTPIQQ